MKLQAMKDPLLRRPVGMETNRDSGSMGNGTVANLGEGQARCGILHPLAQGHLEAEL